MELGSILGKYIDRPRALRDGHMSGKLVTGNSKDEKESGKKRFKRIPAEGRLRLVT